MLRNLTRIVCLLALATLVQAAQPVRILFIGNSFTFVNNLPEIFTKLAAGGGIDIQTQMVAVGGSTLNGHIGRGEAQKAIHTGHWDYVILQDESSMGSILIVNGVRHPADPSDMWHGARELDKEIKSVGAKTAFFHTWAWRAAPEAQAMLDYAYMTIAKELGAIDIPVGPAWQNAMREAPSLGVNLYVADGAHPSPAGSYLAACEFYTTLFGKSPVGLPAKLVGIPYVAGRAAAPPEPTTLVDLTPEKAAGLQKAAWQTHETVLHGAYMSLKRPDAPELPSLPAGQKAPDTVVEGDYSGTLTLFDAPARMDLHLDRNAQGAWVGKLKLTFAGNQRDMEATLTKVEIGEGGIQFEDATESVPQLYDGQKMLPATLTFRGLPGDRGLRGVAEIHVKEGNRLYAAGTWTETRKQ